MVVVVVVAVATLPTKTNLQPQQPISATAMAGIVGWMDKRIVANGMRIVDMDVGHMFGRMDAVLRVIGRLDICMDASFLFGPINQHMMEMLYVARSKEGVSKHGEHRFVLHQYGRTTTTDTETTTETETTTTTVAGTSANLL